MSASVGFEFAEELGFECVLGNELNKIRAKWSQEKFPNADIVQGSFTDPKVFSYLVRKFKEEGCRLATFSPNCQPFSKAGKQHLHSTEAFLFLHILKFIKLTMAENAWIENALEFRNAVLNDDPRTVEQRIRDELEPLGYHIEVKVQDAAGFKTPQHRRRTIFLISRIGIWKHPIECEEKDYVTVRQTIDHLPSVEAGERSHILLQKIKKDFTSCPQEIPDSTICYENITKYLLQNFYKNFDTDWENYLQFKALAEKIYAVIFCENKFSDIGGTMCDIDTQIRVADVLRDYTTTLLHSTEKFFDDYHYFLHNCK